MEFYFKEENGKLHLYQEDGFFDKHLGKLTKNRKGKLETSNLFAENYILEDISGYGERFTIKGSKGLNGILERKPKAKDKRYILVK